LFQRAHRARYGPYARPMRWGRDLPRRSAFYRGESPEPGRRQRRESAAETARAKQDTASIRWRMSMATNPVWLYATKTKRRAVDRALAAPRARHRLAESSATSATSATTREDAAPLDIGLRLSPLKKRACVFSYGLVGGELRSPARLAPTRYRGGDSLDGGKLRSILRAKQADSSPQLRG